MSRLPELATELDSSGSVGFAPTVYGGIYPIRTRGLRTRSSPTPCVGLGGLMSRPENAVLSVGSLSPLLVPTILGHTGHT